MQWFMCSSRFFKKTYKENDFFSILLLRIFALPDARDKDECSMRYLSVFNYK